MSQEFDNNLTNSIEEKPEKEHTRPLLWQGGKWKDATRRLYITLSIIIDVVIIIVLLVVLQQIFTITSFINDGVLFGLYYNFVLMDRAHITTTVQVQETIRVVDTIPVVFTLPLEQNTEVILTKDTPIKDATIYLNNQPVPLDLTLKAGTPLNIQLDLNVPVSQTIPVELNVPVNLSIPVDISLDETQLHDPFQGLQKVVAPYFWALEGLPDSWSGVPAYIRTLITKSE